MESTEVVDVVDLATKVDLYGLAIRELRLKYSILCHITGHNFHGRVTCMLCGLSRKQDPTAEENTESKEAYYDKPLPVERD